MTTVNLNMFMHQRRPVTSAMHHLKEGCFATYIRDTGNWRIMTDDFKSVLEIRSHTFRLLNSHGVFNKVDDRFYISDNHPEFVFDARKVD